MRGSTTHHRGGAIARRLIVAALVALLAVSAAVPAIFPAVAAAAGIKVVVIVGPVEGLTATYRGWAEKVALTAEKYGADVRRIYSPNATWANVLNHIQGASIVVYMGHGNGFPSPYSSTLNPDKVDGFGLNTATSPSDYSHVYYGESYVARYVKLAPSAVVFLSHACYAAGSSESWDVDPTVSVAKQRVDNFAAGFIGAGARAVFALAHADPSPYVTRILTSTTTTMKAIFETAVDWNGAYVQRFASVRSPGFDAELDPSLDTRLTPPQPSYYLRSLVTYPGLTAAQVRGLDPTTPPPSTGPSSYGRWVKVTSGPVNIRSGPATSSSIVGQYGTGVDFYAAQVQTLGGSYTAPDGSTRSDWVSTTFNGLTAWVAKGFTKDDGYVQVKGSGINIRGGASTSYAVYAYTTSTSVVRKSDGNVLGSLSMLLPLSGYVSGGSYTVGGVTSSSWGKVYLGGGWRYVGKLLVNPASP